jgi:hypothetical protein
MEKLRVSYGSQNTPIKTKNCPEHVSRMRGKKETGITILVGKSLCMWASNRTNEIQGRTDDAFFPSYFNLYNENSQICS